MSVCNLCTVDNFYQIDLRICRLDSVQILNVSRSICFEFIADAPLVWAVIFKLVFLIQFKLLSSNIKIFSNYSFDAPPLSTVIFGNKIINSFLIFLYFTFLLIDLDHRCPSALVTSHAAWTRAFLSSMYPGAHHFSLLRCNSFCI